MKKKYKGKVFYGQEFPNGESTTTECRVNCQLLEVITEIAQLETPSGSLPQPRPCHYPNDNGFRDG